MNEDLQKQIQQLQDILQGSINQRNAAQNECLQLAAQVAALSRENAELKEKLAQAAAPELPLPKPNGKHAEAPAAQ